MTHTHTHTFGWSPAYEGSDSQIPLPDNTQYSQDTDIHAPDGIRPCNPRNRAAVDTRLRRRGHRNWRCANMNIKHDVID
jgi:hypothetical protein